MVAPEFLRDGIYRKSRSGEEVLPTEFPGGIGVFAGEGGWQPDLAEAILEVRLVEVLHGLNLLLEGGDEALGEEGEVVVFILVVADEDLTVAEVEVFNAQAQAGAVEQLGHKFGDAAQGAPLSLEWRLLWKRR